MPKLWAIAHQIEWFKLVFLFVLPIYGAYQIPYTPLHINTLAWTFAFYCFTGVGITAGYHRLWSHSAYSATVPLRVLLAIAGTGALQGSIGWWCSRHRSHHRFTDTDKDPYGMNKGFWHSHMGWMMWKQPKKKEARVDSRDLYNDPVVRWQHRYISTLQLFTGVIIPISVPGLLWNDWKGGFIYAFILRMFAVHQATFSVNSLAHWLGEAPFDDRHSPRDHYITALVTFGEGYHNFHHTFPSDYRNALKWWQYDPTKWMIRMWAAMGLAYDLKEFPSIEVDKSRLQQERKVLLEMQNVVDKKLAAIDTTVPLAQLPVMEWEEYVEATKQGKALIVIAGVVHDVEHFAGIHPGGKGMITSGIGKDATAMFAGGVYAHGRTARNVLAGLRVAVIRGGGEVEVWKSAKGVQGEARDKDMITI